MIYVPFAYIMRFCIWIAQNSYLFGLFFFALVFQILLFPFAIKQQKSQISRAKILPKEMAIRERYAGRTDRVTQQKVQQEIQEMYQREGYSPFAGCLPLLIQLPLIFILFAIVRQPIQYSSSFTDAATNGVKTRLEETEENVSGDFVDLFAQYAFDYAEDIRANLVKDNDAAKEADRLLTEKLGELGSFKENADGTDKIDQTKYDNGYDKHTFYKSSTYRELGVVEIVSNYGEDYVAQLKEKGALPEQYEPAYPLYILSNTGEKQYFADMMPNFSFLGVNLLLNPSFTDNDSLGEWLLLLVPLLVFLTSFLNTKIARHFQPAQIGPDGKEVGTGLFMTVGMPLMSTVFSLMFPAAIGAYWVWRTLLSMVQPVVLHKLYPIPVYSKEEMEEMKKELRGKQKKKKIITIEVDEDDDSFRDLEVRGSAPSGNSSVQSARPKDEGKKQGRQEALPYRKPTKIEMLSAEDDEEPNPPADEE